MEFQESPQESPPEISCITKALLLSIYNSFCTHRVFIVCGDLSAGRNRAFLNLIFVLSARGRVYNFILPVKIKVVVRVFLKAQLFRTTEQLMIQASAFPTDITGTHSTPILLCHLRSYCTCRNIVP